MRRGAKKLSLDEQNKLDQDIDYVQGVFDLLLCTITSDLQPEPESVSAVIFDAQNKMRNIKESVDVLTTA